jgi:hypothetical protein
MNELQMEGLSWMRTIELTADHRAVMDENN